MYFKIVLNETSACTHRVCSIIIALCLEHITYVVLSLQYV